MVKLKQSIKKQNTRFVFFNWEILLLTIFIFSVIPNGYYFCSLFGLGCALEFISGFYIIVAPARILFTQNVFFSLLFGVSISYVLSIGLYNLFSQSKIPSKYLSLFLTLVVCLALISFITYPIYLNEVFFHNEILKEEGIRNKNPEHCSKIKTPMKVIGNPDFKFIKSTSISYRDECYMYIIQETNDTSFCKNIIDHNNSLYSDKYRVYCKNIETY